MRDFAKVFNAGSLRKFDKLFDASLHTEDGSEFKVHRWQLSVRNLYFKSLFCGNFLEKTDALICDVDGNTMGIILDYLYTGCVLINRHNVMDLWIASDYLLVDDLKEQCASFVLQEIDETNCLGIYLTVWKIQGLGLLDQCFRYLVVHFGEIVRHYFSADNRNTSETLEIMREMPFDALKKILDNRSLNITGERMVWEVILAWTTLDFFKRLHFIPQLLECLFLEDTDPALVTDVQEHPIFKHNPFCDAYQLKPFYAGDIQPLLFSSGTRNPPCLHFVAQYCTTGTHYGLSDNQAYLDLYITYDNDLGTWRKLATKVALCPDFLVQIGHSMYMFDAWMNRSMAFNVLDCTKRSIPPIKKDRTGYCVVSLGNHIYVMGGVTARYEHSDTIERYDPIKNKWDTIAPMHPMILSEVIALNGCIYAIGDLGGASNPMMMVQMYKPELNLWYAVKAPKHFRHAFATVVHRNRLFLIGGEGLHSVQGTAEEYNPEEDTWRMLPVLPFAYVFPKAVELQDRLIVYEVHLETRRLGKASPPVFLDQDNWKIIDDSSPLHKLHLFQFLTIRQPEIVRNVMRENRAPGIKWTKSALV